MQIFHLGTRNQIEWELHGLIFLLKDTGIVIDYKLNKSQQCGTTAKSSVKKINIGSYLFCAGQITPKYYFLVPALI